jgi:hypothetical protein
MEAEKITMRLTGTRPLLMHSSRLADPLDPIRTRLTKVTSKRAKTLADHLEISKIEWHGGLWTCGGRPCIPAEALLSTFKSAARARNKGQEATAGIQIGRPAILDYDGPRDLDALGADERFVFRTTVRVGRARTIRTRARFDNWAVEYLPTLLNRSEVIDTFMTAGFTKGLGDWRPTFGTYLAEERKE